MSGENTNTDNSTNNSAARIALIASHFNGIYIIN